MPRAARSFADDIRARPDEDLAGLFLARPDLARPAPTDITSLAARAQTRASVQRALEHLDARQLRLLEALLVVGPARAASALGATKKAVDAGIRDLWQLALVWRSAEGFRPVRAVGEILTRPAGLGPSAHDLGVRVALVPLSVDSTPSERDAVVAPLSDRARAVLDQLTWTSPRASFGSAALRAVRTELVEAHLLAPLEGDDAVIPREVGVALRGGRLFQQPWATPEPEIPVLDQRRIDDAAAGAVLDLLWRLDDIAAQWDAEPPRVLRSGGLAVRDHRKLAASIDSPTDLTAFILEVGLAAGLFAADGELDPAWRPTDFYDEWASWPPAERWATLALAWRDTARAPSLAGQSVDGTMLNVLGRDAVWPLLRARRRDVLDVLAALPDGSTPALDAIDELLRWRRPLRLSADAPTRADIVVREAEWLGMTGSGGLTTAARALLPAPPADEVLQPGSDRSALRPAVDAMAASLPRPVDRVMLQGDLTAVAPGPLTEDVATFLRRAADVESRGGATVFRFSDASIRRLLDHGVSADEALDRLAAVSLTPVPQALDYLVRDIARRHGHLRVGTVGSYVRADDDVALDALLADTSLATLHLRRIAPTVLVSPVPAATLLDTLREARHAPVAETSDGGVVVRTSDAGRAHAPRRRSTPVQVAGIDAAQAAELAANVRRGETEAVRPREHDARERIPTSDPTVTLTMLQDAALESLPVWIGFVDSSGDIKRSLFHAERVDGGRVTGRLGDSPRTTTLSIHRITGVAQA